MPPHIAARAATALRSLGGFGGSVLLSGAVSVAVVPVVIVAAGAGPWAGIAIAQAIASFVGVVITFGWAVTGPAAVAGMTLDNRGAYFRSSVTGRLLLAVVCIPVLVVVVWAVAPGDRLANALAATALALPALGGSWFFVGEGAPLRLLMLDTVPRALGSVTGAALLLGGGLPLAAFGGGQVLGAATAVALGWASVLRRHPGGMRFDPTGDLGRLRAQASGVVTAVTAALYVNLPVVLAGALVAADQAALYAIVDKLQKLALTAISPVFQVSQGSVGRTAPADRPAKARSVAAGAVGFGLVVAAGFCALGAVGVLVLSHGEIRAAPAVVVALGIALGAITVSAIVGLACLTALGAVRQVAISTVLGAVVGVPSIVVAGLLFGITGIAVAAAVSEVVVTIYQLVVLRRRIGASEPVPGPPPLLGSPTSWGRESAPGG